MAGPEQEEGGGHGRSEGHREDQREESDGGGRGEDEEDAGEKNILNAKMQVVDNFFFKKTLPAVSNTALQARFFTEFLPPPDNLPWETVQ